MFQNPCLKVECLRLDPDGPNRWYTDNVVDELCKYSTCTKILGLPKLVVFKWYSFFTASKASHLIQLGHLEIADENRMDGGSRNFFLF